MYYDESGFWTRYDIAMEVEQAPAHPHPPPPPPQGGKGSSGNGDRSKNKGRWQDPGVGPSSTRSQQPPAKKPSTSSGKGKEEAHDEYDILDNGDLVQVFSAQSQQASEEISSEEILVSETLIDGENQIPEDHAEQILPLVSYMDPISQLPPVDKLVSLPIETRRSI